MSKDVEKGSLSVVVWFLGMPLKGKAQTSDPPITGGCYVFHPPTSQILEYSRRTQLIWEITPTSATDYDIMPWGIEENPVIIVGWKVIDGNGNDAGGEFGYTPDGYSFYPVSNPEKVNCYRPRPDFVGILKIAPVLDDIPIGMYSGLPTYDDDTTVGDPWRMTVWEFWITPCPYNWRPIPNTTGPSFIAWVEPEVDHLGQPMNGIITFNLISSTEPGECLNNYFSCPYDIDIVQNEEGETFEVHDIHDHDADLQFPPDLEGMEVYGSQEEDEEGSYTHNFTVAVTQQPTTAAEVHILCFDGGGYGFLLAHIDGFPPGSATARRTDTGVIGSVEIPYDADGNFIADVWERNLGIYPADPLGDFDNQPIGDGTPGDGLSVYEEYRGLMVRRSWTVFNPWLKDMFVMNFGAGQADPYKSPTIPNEAITSQDGFPGAGMPILWLLNANEGEGYPLRVVNFLNSYAHNRDVYAAIVVPGTQLVNSNAYAETWGAIWGEGLPPVNAPIIEVNRDKLEADVNDHQNWNIQRWPFEACLTHNIAHELGHTVLWHRNDLGSHGHHNGHDQQGNPVTTLDCHIWEYFAWHEWVALPTEFCANNPGCIFRWKLNP